MSLKQKASLSLYRWSLPLLSVWGKTRLNRGASQSFRNQAIERSRERDGYLPADLQPNGTIIHGASVGEIIAARPLIEELLQIPSAQSLTVTCMTATGSEQILQLFGERVQHCFLPIDRPAAVTRFLDRLNPKALLLLETEIWPNLAHACAERSIPIGLINARLSPKNFSSYLRIRALIEPALSTFALVLAQTEQDRERFVQLGHTDTEVCGNLKFDLQIDPYQTVKAEQIKQLLPQTSRLWLAASTHAGEEEIVLQAHKQLLDRHADAILILVPRHPQRFDEVEALVRDSEMTLMRSSELAWNQLSDPFNRQVLLVDQMGELLSWYAVSPISFIGGSLTDVGGHNPIEPALLESAILTGPERSNFEFVYPQLLEVGAALEVKDAAKLTDAILSLMENPGELEQMLARASATVEIHRGCLDRTLERIRTLIAGQAADQNRPPPESRQK